jgi:hypothetical protein
LTASIYLPICRRCCSGCTPAAACAAQELERSVKGMLPWTQLTGVEKAVEMLYDAFRRAAYCGGRRF